MEAQASFVGADGRIELYPVTSVHPNVARIIGPWNAERNHAFRLDHALQQGMALVLGVVFNERNDGLCDLFDGLQKLRLVGIAA